MWWAEALAFKKERKKGFDLQGGGDGGLDEVGNIRLRFL